MPTSEAARHDLYTGLTELLGVQRAETLMGYLPTFDPDELATKADLAAPGAEIGELRSELHGGLAQISGRIDRLFLTLVAGLFVIVAAMAGVVSPRCSAADRPGPVLVSPNPRAGSAAG